MSWLAIFAGVAAFDERDAVRSQYVTLFVLVIYSLVRLWLLLKA